MVNKDFTYAIVGASNKPEKYGYIVLKDLYLSDFKVIPVNLNEPEVLGLKAYKHLKDIPEKIDVVIFIIPPKATEEVLKEVFDLGITKVWMQPGSESVKAIEYCEENNIECIFERCIMVERRLIDYKPID